ncbi:sigma-54 interaction domain-containing protein [Clostridium sp. MT-14]|uniref:Sigma 54-interacting transcriptional regulator n=1 Tax=Clostridium aromativorans TaxID=2836848 RepID=A0ABS8N2R6_9CLOT|nr:MULTISPECIES: sigma 54-interacting transcriptional regulator [Clostridium]KAA8676564.1 AAA family ATPase [Clostridium sp. HV4-5-A1G]MCC9294083.1 sigma 54-interacting transcriptional regulator [Clostridium aromativorans]CAB1239561.1 Propionate catabolism operon regulatory protein [Clostridiaceae bacterium BL-3]
MNDKISRIELKQYISNINHMIFYNISLPVIFVDAKCNILDVNPAFTKFFQITLKDLEDSQVENIIPNSKLPDVIKTGIPENEKIYKFNDKTKVIIHSIPLLYGNQLIGGMSLFTSESFDNTDMANKFNSINASFHAKYNFNDILVNSTSGKKCKKMAEKFALSNFTVLITGESGVGKEMFAHAIHNKSKRRLNPFVKVNCAAIPENLAESELFGYDSGSFTGASKEGKCGKFELANGGTIFLDEIGDIPLVLQAKLLRVLQENEVERIGSNKIINIDVRVIAATNCDLKKKVLQGTFRKDLFYRLNFLNLEIPPLRERKGDIDILVESIQNRFYQKYNIKKYFPDNILKVLSSYDWPGNIRELTNILGRIMVTSKNKVITMDDLPEFLLEDNHQNDLNENNKDKLLKNSIHETESKLIMNTLIKNNFNKSKTAETLGIPRMTLYRKLKKLFPSENSSHFI